MNALAVLNMIDALMTGYLKLQESRARVQAIVDEGREPTDEEMADIFNNDESLATIRDAAGH